MSKRAELDELQRAMAKAVLGELTEKQRAFFEEDPRAPYDLDIWIGGASGRAVEQVAKKARTYYRRFARR